jgi:hypothetical protein
MTAAVGLPGSMSVCSTSMAIIADAILCAVKDRSGAYNADDSLSKRLKAISSPSSVPNWAVTMQAPEVKRHEAACQDERQGDRSAAQQEADA